MSSPEPITSDAELCARIRRGDAGAFRVLFNTFYIPLCRYATSLVGNPDASEDIVQGLFTRLWEQRERWVVRGNLKSYLYQAVHRRVVSDWRAGLVRRRYAERELQSAAASTPVDSAVDGAELIAAYERTMATLTPRLREAFELHCQHGLSYREVAAIMGISPRTVETHVGRAILVFRKALAAYLAVALVISGR